eukprot:TRINITY_DN1016_c0_g1_i1.p1 TRINITY_DN1016_c0_g1~~TRINITY_DN1016_c0_g1_i1.p1  ORF type:complete len:222 (-),score=30.45 TRINITY_DN1016_c0_g1_i1:188-853(-)
MEEPSVVLLRGSTKYVPKKINVNQNRDPGDRYWMHQLVINVSGRGRLTKTILVNAKQVAAQLRVNPEFLTSFISSELGVLAKYDKNSAKPTATLNGDIDAGVLADTLQSFIHKFVLCPTCGLPEVTIRNGSVSDVGDITEKLQNLEISKTKKNDGVQGEAFLMSCRGCGARSPLRVKNKLLRKYMTKNADNLGVSSAADDFGVSSSSRIASLDCFSPSFDL